MYIPKPIQELPWTFAPLEINVNFSKNKKITSITCIFLHVWYTSPTKTWSNRAKHDSRNEVRKCNWALLGGTAEVWGYDPCEASAANAAGHPASKLACERANKPPFYEGGVV